MIGFDSSLVLQETPIDVMFTASITSRDHDNL